MEEEEEEVEKEAICDLSLVGWGIALEMGKERGKCEALSVVKWNRNIFVSINRGWLRMELGEGRCWL